MTLPILDWAAAEAAGPAVAGGKGWQLGRLDRFGIPVPPGFVIAAIDSGEERSGEPLPPALIACDAAGALDFTGTAYDLEWVWDGTRFWIVQARPVTAVARRTYPGLMSQPTWWSRGNTREILPQPLSPVDWRLSRTMANRMLTRGYELSGYATLPGIERAGLFHGRVYLQTSVMQWEGYDALGVPPKAMNQLLGGRQPEIVVPPATAARRRAWGLRLLRYLHRAGRQRKHAATALSEARQAAAAWLAQDLPVDNSALAQTLRQQFYAVHGVDDLYFMQGSAGGTLFNLVQMVEKYCPGEGHARTAALMAGGEPSVTATQGYDLTALARIAQDDSQALAWLRRPGRVAGDWCRELPQANPFRLAFEGFLARYGHRGVYETYLRHPTWREAPDYLLDSVLNLIGSDPDALRERQRLGAVAAWQRLRSAVPFWVRPIIGKLVKVASADCNNREAARSALVAYLEVLRRGVLALGRRFAGQGAFDRPDDIFNLLEPEVLALAEGRLPAAAAARRAAHRGGQLAAWTDEAEPEVVAEHGGLSTKVAVDPAAVEGEGAVLWRGTAVGGGRAQGRVRIARMPADGLNMAAGDVLVAGATDPAWTPLFLKAGALVMETGGYLSHGAIVAREFGIPAVVNLPGILDRLRDGDQVSVDGGEGTVRRLSTQ